jgi:hypothetical protein
MKFIASWCRPIQPSDLFWACVINVQTGQACPGPALTRMDLEAFPAGAEPPAWSAHIL